MNDIKTETDTLVLEQSNIKIETSCSSPSRDENEDIELNNFNCETNNQPRNSYARELRQFSFDELSRNNPIDKWTHIKSWGILFLSVTDVVTDILAGVKFGIWDKEYVICGITLGLVIIPSISLGIFFGKKTT